MAEEEKGPVQEKEEILVVYVQVHEKEIEVSCGSGTQRVKWLGHVGIARYDEETYEGWRQLGIPVTIEKVDMESNGRTELNMGQVIREVLQDGDRVKVTTSLTPNGSG